MLNQLGGQCAQRRQQEYITLVLLLNSSLPYSGDSFAVAPTK